MDLHQITTDLVIKTKLIARVKVTVATMAVVGNYGNYNFNSRPQYQNNYQRSTNNYQQTKFLERDFSKRRTPEVAYFNSASNNDECSIQHVHKNFIFSNDNDKSILLSDDTTCMPLYRDNLVKICINECIRVFALIDSGANISAISSKTVDKLREAGQRCNIYNIPDQKLVAANGQPLNVIGVTYILKS